MSIIASCGHSVEDIDQSYNVAIKAWEITEEGWVRAIHYQSVCEACKKEYQADNYILLGEEEENNWFKGIE